MPIPQHILLELYIQQKLSMSDIASRLHCSQHRVIYWMQQYHIKRRSRSDANYAKYNPHGEPFSVNNPLLPAEIPLYYLALGLYWGEGGKTQPHSTRLTNSDPAVILVFYQFLITICHINPRKIHFHLQTFKNQSTALALQYWIKKLNVSREQFTTCTPISTIGKGNYHKINQNGVITIGVYNTHFQKWIMAELTKLGYNPHI